MSLPSVKQALELFATAADNQAIVLKGPWGTGKTHLWNQVVKEKKEKFFHEHYAYVSLFGLNSLGDLKRSIFDSTVSKSIADTEVTVQGLVSNLDTLKENAKNWAKVGSGHITSIFRNVGPTVDSLQFASVTKTLICIDDFERKGSSLSDRDVLGLISLLVETKKCRVLLILNDKTLKADAEFFSFNEKVFNFELVFNPTPAECASLVFNAGNQADKALAANSEKLGINNIRLLHKISLFQKILKPYTDVWKEAINKQAFHTLPLAVLAIYGSAISKINLDLLTSLDYRRISVFEKSQGDPDKLAQAEIDEGITFITEYGFGVCDDFDLAIINLVKNGFADSEHINAIIQALDVKIKFDEDYAVYKQAWAKCGDSFDLNDAEIFETFQNALGVCLVHLSVAKLDYVSQIYEVLGKEDVFRKHVDTYFEHAKANGFIDFDEDFHSGELSPYIAFKINDFNESIQVQKYLSDIFSIRPDMGSFDEDEIMLLSAFSADEYYSFFKSLRGESIPEIIKKILKQGSTQSFGEDMYNVNSRIMVHSFEAIKRIADESPLNAHRVRHFLRYIGDYDRCKNQLEAEA